MSLYNQVENADGTVTYVEVDEATLTETVKAHPLHQKVLGESIERRKEIQSLKAPKLDEVTPVQPTVPALDEEAILQKILAKLDGERKQQSERDAKIDGLLKQHSLQPTLREVLVNAVNPDAVAETLARVSNTFVVTPSANPSDAPTLVEATMDKVNKRLYGEPNNAK